VIPETVQLVVPEAVPLPPRSFVQVTWVTATLSDAEPPRLSELELVPYAALDVGDEIEMEGAVVSGGV
jgi:hypothetical protein